MMIPSRIAIFLFVTLAMNGLLQAAQVQWPSGASPNAGPPRNSRIWDAPTQASTGAIASLDEAQVAPVPQIIQYGAKPFATILLRFHDYPNETPHPPGYYQGLMSNTYPGMDYYIREMSYGQCTLAGSVVLGWYTLPQPESYYLTATGDFDTTKIPHDAAILASQDVDLTKFYGLNLVVNNAVPNSSITGNRASEGDSSLAVTLNGETQYFGVTFMQPDHDGQGSFAHEMGHALGFDHSSGPYFPNEQLYGPHTYDSHWDVMSSGYWYPNPAPYSNLGVDYNAYHKDVAGWIPAAQKYVAFPGTSQTINIERSDSPTNSDYLMAQVWIPGAATQYYTVEARRKVGFDQGIPAEGIILHQVDTDRVDRQSQVVDTDNDGNPNVGSAIYTPSVGHNLFTDVPNGITIKVNSLSATGYSITITVAQTNIKPYIVTNTNDTGIGSLRNALRWAVLYANTTISFHIPTTDHGYSGGVFTIHPLSPLPTLSSVGTVIDGTTEGTFLNSHPTHPLIAIDGANATQYANGMTVTASKCTLNTIAVEHFAGSGVWINGCTGCQLRGCYIGITPDGTTAAANQNGVWVDSGATANIIGGTRSTGNVISGNTYSGIYMTDAATSANVIAGNTIGLNAAGTAAVGNTGAGISQANGSHGNIIGGSATGTGNIISGNNYQGIYIGGAGTNGNTISGNTIGLNALGTTALPNNSDGLALVLGSSNNKVGGTTAATVNVISGNKGNGIYLGDNGTHANVITGNIIGLNTAGNTAIGNADGGLAITNGASSNTIGGSATGAGNVISGNKGNGIYLGDSQTQTNIIVGNIIGLNSTSSAALGNAYSGISLSNGTHGNSIGGTSANTRNLISGNTYQGIYIGGTGTNSNVVTGNYIGVNLTGSGVNPNNGDGIDIIGGASSNTVGGAGSAGNIISGNKGNGIYLGDSGTIGNVISGNIIGANAAGSAALGNGYSGVSLGNGCHGNTIGSIRNLISGNIGQGVYIGGAGTSNNTVSGNYIGVNAAGAAVLSNNGDGVDILSGASGNTIGGAGSAGNVISGNKGNGIYVGDGGTHANLLIGNIIGLNAGRTAGLSNAYSGMVITNGAYGNTVGGSINSANIIADSTYQGIYLSGSATVGNTIRANRIFGDQYLGIDLSGGTEVGYNVTLNHTGSVSGPNHLQNYPVLSVSTTSSSSTVISGTLNSLPNTTYSLDFYADSVAHASGYGEGQDYLGALSVTTNSSGNASFSFSVSGAAPYSWVTGTATNNATGDTSEFCKDVSVGGYSSPASVTLSPSNPNGTNGYYTVPVSVALTAVAGSLGPASATYTLDNGASQTYSTPFTVSTDGTHTVIFKITDRSGTIEAPVTVTFKIDRTTPSTAATTATSTTGVKVTLAATDNYSGVGTTYYTIDSGTQATYSAPFLVSLNGAHTIHYHSTDKAGNAEAAKTLTFTASVALPVTKAALSGTLGSNNYYRSRVTVTLTAAAGGLPIAHTYYSLDGGALQTYSVAVVVSANAAHTITYYSVDTAGNAEAQKSIVFKIDTTPPVTTSTLLVVTAGEQVTLAATDNLSGVATTFYSVDGGAQKTYTVAFTVTGKGKHTVTYASTDKAGNVETTKTVNFTL